MEYKLKNYFPEQETIQTFNDQNKPHQNQIYEFIPYQPAAASSEMMGTSIEELLMHNFESKRSWECSRLCNFPQEVVLRLNYRSHMKFLILRSKVGKPIQEVEIYLADGVTGNFTDADYRKVSRARNITEEGLTIKIDGIGTFIKLRFTKPSMKTQNNPFGQVSLAQVKVFGKKINHLLYYDQFADENRVQEEKVDEILINLGLPLNDPYFMVNDQNYEIAPCDEDTKITLRDLLTILKRAGSGKLLNLFKPSIFK
jgi:hypothetical protein